MSKYVHDKVHLVCSNGMTKSNLIVKDRNGNIVQNKLWATIKDKPNTFGCKWLGIIIAALTALILVATAATGGLAAIAIGAAVGALAATGAGMSGIPWCYLATMNADWEKYHQTVKLGGEKLLLETSTLTCKIGFGGKVYIFYSEAAANRQRNAFATRNLVEIIGAAGAGAFLGSGVAIYSASGLISTQMGIYLGFGLANYSVGQAIDGQLDAGRDAVAASLVPYSNQGQTPSDMTNHKNADNDSYERATFQFDDAPSLISDPIILHQDIKQGTASPKETPKISRAEMRRLYLQKTKPVKDSRGTYRRPTNVPKSLRNDTRLNPQNKSQNIATAGNRAAANAYIVRKGWLNKFGKGLKEFAALTAFTWLVDVASASLQRDADNKRDADESPAKALVNVQAKNY